MCMLCTGTIDTPSLSDRMRALGDYDTVSLACYSTFVTC